MASVENELTFDEMLKEAAKKRERVVRLPRLALVRSCEADIKDILRSTHNDGPSLDKTIATDTEWEQFIASIDVSRK